MCLLRLSSALFAGVHGTLPCLPWECTNAATGSLFRWLILSIWLNAYPPGLPQDWLLADLVDEAASMAVSTAAMMLVAVEAPAQADLSCWKTAS